MASDELSSTLRFLSDAGHLLAKSSPETSAFLMKTRDGLLFEHEIPLAEAEKQHICSCCGHIMIPEHGSSLGFRSKKRTVGRPGTAGQQRSNQPKGVEPQPSLTKAITCGHCGRLTEVKVPAPAPISRRNRMKPLVSGTASVVQTRVSQEDPAQKGNANASSKKRAKSRKAGLQALLDQSNATKDSKTGLGLGLSLADFMQK